ncbi:AraC-like DNA-binding protein [Aquimarina sp. EL_43]|uniref:helix-turn-helix domain-containing protein n=1 Tax=Aquimarina TaxID=290174 RepID=UPI000472FCD1|nr:MULTISPECIES: AraC family transcriptional regulator [Aquimarina]MBG6129250.1 AraC-like DNA-binding protein [Aquimarina sp. EL_35]MBG6150315.1 AraC-like DNA-binding protein [Aquimarina sp. EL_32]MBG6166999.1 AraC-like DNA-binding protein [Aquimarina sp. EL_43]
MTSENEIVTSKKWELDKISISHNIIDYKTFGSYISKNDSESVRLHFGLSGNYNFKYKQLNSSFDLVGSHNNIMYSKGIEIEVSNKSKRIETFGVNFNTDFFIHIAQNGNESLKKLADKVILNENAILSNEWRPNNFKIQQVINEILYAQYTNELKDLFLLSKSIELLVLQAELYELNTTNKFIKSNSDKQKLFEAKEILTLQIDNPPTISQLSKLIGLNEYKLKKGFKELFGTTVFGYIHNNRMNLAKRLLLGTDLSAKEIAYKTGYSSPQHFSKAFKKEFGTTPDSIRNYPDRTI